MKGRNSIIRRSRFERPQDEAAAEFLSSMSQDRKILDADIWVDKAHVLMLNRQRIVSNEHAHTILGALDGIASSNRGELMSRKLDDVHLLLETELIRRLGEDVGGRLHTARSRNDEVATCLRIVLRDELMLILEGICRMQDVLLELASEHTHTIMPGYTHLQRAQPTTLAHHLMAHVYALQRDAGRLMGCYDRANVSPLGAGAMASTTFPIDPHLTASLLGFESVAQNSIDAVASRDFLLEALSCLSILGANLSRVAEELVLWSTSEFGFIQLADEYSSTSSIMPQKRNPDVAELVRARISSVMGSLFSGLSICKALPLSYNMDFQEATAHLWRATETVESILAVLKGTISTMRVQKESMSRAATWGLPWATDLADLIVMEQGLPFRTAHSIMAAVARDWNDDKDPARIALEIARASKAILGREIVLSHDKVSRALDVQSNIAQKRVCGGPAPVEVRKSIRRVKASVSRTLSWLSGKKRRIASAREEVAALQAALSP